jgi:hypothetical protein
VLRDNVSAETIGVWHLFYTFNVVRHKLTMLQNQGDSRCKMAGAGSQAIAKSRTPLFNAVITDRVCFPRIFTRKMDILLIAIVSRLNLRADCHWPEPSAWLIIGRRAGAGNPHCI